MAKDLLYTDFPGYFAWEEMAQEEEKRWKSNWKSSNGKFLLQADGDLFIEDSTSPCERTHMLC